MRLILPFILFCLLVACKREYQYIERNYKEPDTLVNIHVIKAKNDRQAYTYAYTCYCNNLISCCQHPDSINIIDFKLFDENTENVELKLHPKIKQLTKQIIEGLIFSNTDSLAQSITSNLKK